MRTVAAETPSLAAIPAVSSPSTSNSRHSRSRTVRKAASRCASSWRARRTGQGWLRHVHHDLAALHPVDGPGQRGHAAGLVQVARRPRVQGLPDPLGVRVGAEDQHLGPAARREHRDDGRDPVVPGEVPVDQAHVWLGPAHGLDGVRHAAGHGDLVAALDQDGGHRVQEDAVVVPDHEAGHGATRPFPAGTGPAGPGRTGTTIRTCAPPDPGARTSSAPPHDSSSEVTTPSPREAAPGGPWREARAVVDHIDRRPVIPGRDRHPDPAVWPHGPGRVVDHVGQHPPQQGRAGLDGHLRPRLQDHRALMRDPGQLDHLTGQRAQLHLGYGRHPGPGRDLLRDDVQQPGHLQRQQLEPAARVPGQIHIPAHRLDQI